MISRLKKGRMGLGSQKNNQDVVDFCSRGLGVWISCSKKGYEISQDQSLQKWNIGFPRKLCVVVVVVVDRYSVLVA